jgi:DNA-binding NtrC family response regulator
VPDSEVREAPASEGAPEILLVDDDQIVRDLLRTCLERAGHKVAVAGNGRDAVRWIWQAQSSIRVLVTDIDMPDMSGIELASYAAGVCHCRVLLISGKPQDSDVGWCEFLAKPFTGSILLENVDRLLDAANCDNAIKANTR